MLPTASPFVSCWRNCSMQAPFPVASCGGEPAPSLLHQEVAALLDPVDSVELSHPVALGVEGDPPGEAREVLEARLEVSAEHVGGRRLRRLDGLHHAPEAVARQHTVD